MSSVWHAGPLICLCEFFKYFLELSKEVFMANNNTTYMSVPK